MMEHLSQNGAASFEAVIDIRNTASKALAASLQFAPSETRRPRRTLAARIANAPSLRLCISQLRIHFCKHAARYYLGTQKAPAAKRGKVDEMLWVDHASCISGLTAAQAERACALRERRRYDYAGHAPLRRSVGCGCDSRSSGPWRRGALRWCGRRCCDARRILRRRRRRARTIGIRRHRRLRGRNGDVRPTLWDSIASAPQCTTRPALDQSG